MTRSRLRSAVLFAALVIAGPALADARADLKASYAKFIATSSFRAEMTDLDSGKVANRIEFVAPDRYAITIQGNLRQVIIGRTLYMNMGDRSISMPLPQSIDPGQYRSQKAIDDLAADITVEQLADEAVDGEAARVYRFTAEGEHGPTDTTTWVSKDSGLPIQIRTSGGSERKYRLQIRYRDFNDPAIRIEKPAG